MAAISRSMPLMASSNRAWYCSPEVTSSSASPATARKVDLLELAQQGAREESCHVLVLEHRQHARDHGADAGRGTIAVGRLGEPSPASLGDVHAGEALHHVLGGEEILLHEAAKALADAVLVVRNDRRVRNRQSQGTAKQRNDGEPIGDRAHDGRLGEGLDPCGPWMRGNAERRYGEQRHHRQQQRQRDPLHSPQIFELGHVDAGFPSRLHVVPRV